MNFFVTNGSFMILDFDNCAKKKPIYCKIYPCGVYSLKTVKSVASNYPHIKKVRKSNVNGLRM